MDPHGPEAPRERRRRDLLRMKRKARRVYPWLDHPEAIANHLRVCSCWMCGNPRKYLTDEPLTRQERWQLAEYRDALRGDLQR